MTEGHGVDITACWFEGNGATWTSFVLLPLSSLPGFLEPAVFLHTLSPTPSISVALSPTLTRSVVHLGIWVTVIQQKWADAFL